MNLWIVTFSGKIKRFSADHSPEPVMAKFEVLCDWARCRKACDWSAGYQGALRLAEL